ncbi:MAG: hypothetical protein IJD83_00415 [Clostridia bacterium]|nr:hypothetical protein [Clostridia bacterium]
MKLTFYTPSYKNTEDFGGATFGFAGAENELLTLSQTFAEDINGTVLYGSYDDVLSDIPDGNWQAGIVLLGNAGNENTFVRALAQRIKAPLVGGSGAICPQTGESALITGHSEAAVFLINDDRFDVSAVSENVHYDILSEHTLTFTGRFVDTIDGCDALTWYNQKRNELGLDENDFEHLTLTDTYGINAHLSVRDGKLFSGRDLDETMVLRYLPIDKAQARIQAFYSGENAIVFGCAGLKQTLSDSIETNNLGLFMFGEVCTVNGHSDFGNLMLSKIVFSKK